MNIGVIGSGNIGGTVARLLAAAGHQVAISNSRGPESLQELVRRIGPNVRAVGIVEAAGAGEVVLVAIPFGQYRTLPAAELAGRIVIDATNYYPQRDGQVELGDLSAGEMIAAAYPTATVVKAFNTLPAETLAQEAGRPKDERLALFLCGDDSAAKAVVAQLIADSGYAPVDTGGLSRGRDQEPGGRL